MASFEEPCSVSAPADVATTSRIKRYTAQGLTQTDAMIANVPMGRLAEPEEIANAVLFLTSDDSSYVNGTAQVVGGGAG